MKPILYIIIPCYNEETVLRETAPLFLEKLESLVLAEKVHADSRILFVDDGSRDGTWDVICTLAEQNVAYTGISLSRNRGHQNALLAGLSEAADRCDITISIDCDGQDDIQAMDKMIEEYYGGADIVYGVRDSRKTDSFFKRTTARIFYRFMRIMGAEVVYDHADYRLLSSRVLQELLRYREVNLFLRGMIPLIGFKSTCISYERRERLAGKSHYPLGKMLSLALDGITSLSIRPIRMIFALGFVVACISFLGIVWSVISYFSGNTVAGWPSMVSIFCFVGGMQMLCIGVIGEYVGKIYLESKARPRFIIQERTDKKENTP